MEAAPLQPMHAVVSPKVPSPGPVAARLGHHLAPLGSCQAGAVLLEPYCCACCLAQRRPAQAQYGPCAPCRACPVRVCSACGLPGYGGRACQPVALTNGAYYSMCPDLQLASAFKSRLLGQNHLMHEIEPIYVRSFCSTEMFLQ